MGTIYKFTNTVNGKGYIGKCHSDVKVRYRKHITGRGSKLLKQAFDEYGIENFTFEILHDGILDEFLNDYEIEAIKKHNTKTPNGYNRSDGGQGQLGFKHSIETRRKISELNKGKSIPRKQRKKISKSLKGKYRNPHREKAEAFYSSLPVHLSAVERWITFREKLSEVVRPSTLHRWFQEWEQTAWKQTDTRLKQSVAAKNRPSISEETRRKLVEASTGRKYSVETRRKLAEAQKGKRASAETRRKLSEAHKGRTPHNKSPDRIPAREFFLSLPPDMSLQEKRRLLREKFPERNPSTIYLWVREWTQDT